ncbi:MAG: hypothetical protein WC379_06925 [Methanoregula sp.]|jgi:hypothetical protein
MAEIQSEKTPLARLVLFMVCLAVAASIVAGAHYYAVELPLQEAISAPQNSGMSCQECYDWCSATYPNSGGCKYNCQVYVCNA